MTAPAPAPDAPPLRASAAPARPRARRARRMNALRHGLRSRAFGLLPEEDPAEWAEHLADLRRDLAPADPTEEKLVTALAVAMWKEIRADRTEAGVLTAMPGRRRRAAATWARPRNRPLARHRDPLRHRRRHGDPARPPRLPRPPQGQAGRPDPARRRGEPAECTNDFAGHRRPAPRKSHERIPSRPAAARAIDPLAALRARIRRLLDGAGPHDADQRDLAAAMLAAQAAGRRALPRPDRPRSARPGAAPLRFDAAALAWLAGPRRRPHPSHASGRSPVAAA